ncbi:MAG TPA: hypothetical protein VKJ45_11820 [Blastocatellia bacterium]|nr:hypothetical protein [Blastocatellia bacterium]
MRFLAPLVFLLALPVLSEAQARYLGPGDYGETYITPRYKIPWQGDFTGVTQRRLNKSLNRLDDLAAPENAKSDLASYPAANVSQWIDSGYEAALQKFTDCGGALASKARAVDPSGYFVQVRPTIWQTEASNTGWAAGETIPSQRLIAVVCYYFSEARHQQQWLPALITWEEMNHLAVETGVPGEPGSSKNWPCDSLSTESVQTSHR